MKICLINSSYEGVDSPFEQYDSLPDPNRYIPKSRHEFVTRWVTKANARAEIDEICMEKFDMYMNYMWGTESDDVAGVEAVRYLETKGVPIVINPSTFLSKTRLDLKKAADMTGLLVPKDTPGKYPKIVKYSNGCGSLQLDYNSICHTEEQVRLRVSYLKEQNPKFGTMVEDYIAGRECSAIVIEMGTEVVALTPLQYVFPKHTPSDQEFLTWHNKFETCETGEIQYELVGSEQALKMQEAAVDAFKALGVNDGGGWARVDMRLEDVTGDVYVLEVNSIPVVFYPVCNTLGDDLVVGETFPGGHPALFDMLLATKQMQLGRHNDRSRAMAAFYASLRPKYADMWAATGLRKIQEHFVSNFAFEGTVLDVACGMGHFGHVLHEHGVRADVYGIDACEDMLQSPHVKAHYKQPVQLGPMQELIMAINHVQGPGEFDHIVCFGALGFLDAVELNAVLARMFMLARKSITFDAAEPSAECMNDLFQKSGCVEDNHAKRIEDFGVPRGWRLVHRKREFLFTARTVSHDIYGYATRYERVQELPSGSEQAQR